MNDNEAKQAFTLIVKLTEENNRLKESNNNYRIVLKVADNGKGELLRLLQVEKKEIDKLKEEVNILKETKKLLQEFNTKALNKLNRKDDEIIELEKENQKLRDMKNGEKVNKKLEQDCQRLKLGLESAANVLANMRLENSKLFAFKTNIETLLYNITQVTREAIEERKDDVKKRNDSFDY